MAVRHVLTNIFGKRKVLAYVTSPEKNSGARRLFFSTVFSEQLEILCAWQENPAEPDRQQPYAVYPVASNIFRWNIEVSYYEQKTFWSL